MAEKLDILVIGAGPAGYVCAIRAAQLGLKTGCVEATHYEGGLGGTCLNWGCIPAKALLESAALAQNLKEHGAEMGVRAENVVYDMSAAVDRSRFISEKLTGGIRFLFKKNNVELFEGRGRITGPGAVEVTPEEGDPYVVEAANIVVATGASMMSFPGFEIDGDKVIGSREALALRNLPERMVVVGGGYVGVEFADVFNAFGVNVTVVEMLDTLVPASDSEVGKTLARSFKKRGMEIRTGTKVVSLDRQASPMVLTVESKKGEEKIETDILPDGRGPEARDRRPGARGAGRRDGRTLDQDQRMVRVQRPGHLRHRGRGRAADAGAQGVARRDRRRRAYRRVWLTTRCGTTTSRASATATRRSPASASRRTRRKRPGTRSRWASTR